MENRRKFIHSILVSAGVLYLNPLQAGERNGSFSLKKSESIRLKQNDVILFQGDSITDVGRDREAKEANHTNGLGKGYPFLTSAKLLNDFPKHRLKIYNRGISGNKVPQLQERWEEDCLALQPNVLSILIGINDYWHKRGGNYEGNAQTFKSQFQKLLEDTLKELPEVKLIIGEPFVVKDVKHVTDDWFPEVEEYQKAVREIASEFNALLLPYQKIFDEACKVADGAYWTSDGVHPTLAGAELMSEAWLQFMKR